MEANVGGTEAVDGEAVAAAIDAAEVAVVDAGAPVHDEEVVQEVL